MYSDNYIQFYNSIIENNVISSNVVFDIVNNTFIYQNNTIKDNGESVYNYSANYNVQNLLLYPTLYVNSSNITDGINHIMYGGTLVLASGTYDMLTLSNKIKLISDGEVNITNSNLINLFGMENIHLNGTKITPFMGSYFYNCTLYNSNIIATNRGFSFHYNNLTFINSNNPISMD